jgi:hypothetical protein
MSWPHRLPLEGACIVDVRGAGRFDLVFDDADGGVLSLHGPFELRTGDQVDTYAPPCPDWVRDLLLGLVGVRIETARHRTIGSLRIQFEDGRELTVPDGPYENWVYADRGGRRLHGGVGRVV